MAALEIWWKEVAPRIAALGHPGPLYLVHQGDLIALSVQRGRPIPIPCSSARTRRRTAGSALVRTLRSTAAPALPLGSANASGEPRPALCEALLQELGAQAALLVREKGQLAAVVCVAKLPEGGPREAPLAAVARGAEESWQRVGGPRIRADLQRALARQGAGPSWLRRIRARILAPGPG